MKIEDLISNIKIEKALKGAGIAAASAAVTFLLGYVDVLDVEVKTTLLVSVAAILLNAVKVALTKYTDK